jgi:hypothetical protein
VEAEEVGINVSIALALSVKVHTLMGWEGRSDEAQHQNLLATPAVSF